MLGAAGSAILAAAWPFLIEQYEIAAVAMREFLVIEFQVVNAIAEEGLHGVIQNLSGAVWFLGMGYLLRAKRKGLGSFAIAIGGFSRSKYGRKCLQYRSFEFAGTHGQYSPWAFVVNFYWHLPGATKSSVVNQHDQRSQ